MKQKEQNKIFVVGFLLVALVIVWSLAKPLISKMRGGVENSEEKINAEILKAPLITPDDLNSKIFRKEKVFIEDLRSASEFESSHIPTSQNSAVGADEIEKNIQAGADKNSHIILVNQGDNVFEAAKTTNDLISKGYANARYLQGGFSSWQKQAFAVVSGGRSSLNEAKVKMVNTDQLIEDLNIGEDAIQFIDVRDPESFQSEHIKGAVNIPINNLESSTDQISGVKKLIIYGKDEDEAKKAAISLFDLNYFNAYVLEGSIDAIKNAGQ